MQTGIYIYIQNVEWIIQNNDPSHFMLCMKKALNQMHAVQGTNKPRENICILHLYIYNWTLSVQAVTQYI